MIHTTTNDRVRIASARVACLAITAALVACGSGSDAGAPGGGSPGGAVGNATSGSTNNGGSSAGVSSIGGQPSSAGVAGSSGSTGASGAANAGAGGTAAGAAGSSGTGGVGDGSGGNGTAGGAGSVGTGGGSGALHPADATEHEGHWYRFTQASIGGKDAQAICKGLGGYLACIETQPEDAFIKTLSGTARPWVGLNNEANVDTWVWINGSPTTYTHWQPGQPDNPGNERWVKILEDGSWDDGSIPTSYICEWEG